MKKAFITILSILVFSSEIFSQTNTIRPYTNSIQDSLLVSNTYKCGVSQSYFASKSSNNNNNYISPNNFPTSAIMNCGKFSLYFEDLIPTNPQVGFGDPTLGQTRRNTFCAVLNQIENTFDFSNVDPFSPILIYVYTSYAPNSTVALPAAPANVDWFAQGAPTYNVPNIFTTPVNGYVWDYVVSGQNNVSSNNYYHASIRVNFDQIHTQYYINNTTNGVLSIPIAYHDDLSALINPNDNCKTDLYSVLIHEMGHILGDISFVQFPINSNNPPPPSFFSSLDYSTRISQLANPLSPSSALINSNATYNYSNYNSINNLWLNSNTSPNNYPLLSGMLPYGATTAPYTNNIISSDLFITHFDDQPGSYTLRETISPGEKQDYLMSSVLHKGVSHREFSKGDLYLFHNILGYNYSNPKFK